MTCFKPKLGPDEMFCDCKPNTITDYDRLEMKIREQAKTIAKLEGALQLAGNEIVTLRAINQIRKPH